MVALMLWLVLVLALALDERSLGVRVWSRSDGLR